MLHRESGVFKTSYAADMALYPLPIARWTVAAIVVLFAVVLPLSLHEYYLSIINLSLIAIVGAVVGGLIVGVVESIAAGYLDPFVGGGTKDFAPYVLMILVLMVRPYGIFGTHRIERV